MTTTEVNIPLPDGIGHINTLTLFYDESGDSSAVLLTDVGKMTYFSNNSNLRAQYAMVGSAAVKVTILTNLVAPSGYIRHMGYVMQY